MRLWPISTTPRDSAVVATIKLEAQKFPLDITRGKAVYGPHCQSGYGSDGRGRWLGGAPLKVRPTDFHHSRSFLKSDEDSFQDCRTWRRVQFDAFLARGKLTDGEMNDVVANISGFFPSNDRPTIFVGNRLASPTELHLRQSLSR
jgi:hypothetical protein